MTTKRIVTLLLGGAMLLSTPLVSLGQGRGGSGGGGGGGGDGGGSAGTAAGALYGDLYVIERDGNGQPVLATITDALGGPYTCQQPLAANCAFLPLNGIKPDFNPELEDACAVQADYVGGLQAVTFGRESVSRAPATVIDKSYAEALKLINLATPQCGDPRAIKLDPAGRIALCTLDAVTGNYAWASIDSPLENLGLYRAAMTSGCFGPISEESVGEEGVPITVITSLSDAAKVFLNTAGLGHLVCLDDTTPGTMVDKADMLSAAAFIAAGADKFTPVTLDQIINVNTYLGVNKWTYTTSRKVKTLTITYFQYKVDGGPGGWFGYTKGVDAYADNTDNTVPLLTHLGGDNFTISAVRVFGASPPGIKLTDVTVCRAGAPLSVDSARVFCDSAEGTAGNPPNPVYSSSDPNGCGGANWFAQAAEHARKTIWYLHNFEPPVIAY